MFNTENGDVGFVDYLGVDGFMDFDSANLQLADEILSSAPNVDITNFSTGSVMAENIVTTGASPLIAEMTAQGAEYDALISAQEAQLPNVTSQIYAIQMQMAQNPQLRAALYPMLAQLRQQQNGIEGLVDARTEMMDSLSSIYDAMADTYQTASGNITDAANAVGDIASSIGDINVGEGIEE